MWKEDSLTVNGKIFHYWMKQYEEDSGASRADAVSERNHRRGKLV